MTTSQLLKQNLKLSLGVALLGALVGFILSLAIGLIAHSDALAFKFPSTSGYRSIGTAKLEAFDRMQGTALCIGIIAGLLAAQAVFVVKHLRYSVADETKPQN